LPDPQAWSAIVQLPVRQVTLLIKLKAALDRIFLLCRVSAGKGAGQRPTG
jgi:hypothetical protein